MAEERIIKVCHMLDGVYAMLEMTDGSCVLLSASQFKTLYPSTWNERLSEIKDPSIRKRWEKWGNKPDAEPPKF